LRHQVVELRRNHRRTEAALLSFGLLSRCASTMTLYCVTALYLMTIRLLRTKAIHMAGPGRCSSNRGCSFAPGRGVGGAVLDLLHQDHMVRPVWITMLSWTLSQPAVAKVATTVISPSPVAHVLAAVGAPLAVSKSRRERDKPDKKRWVGGCSARETLLFRECILACGRQAEIDSRVTAFPLRSPAGDAADVPVQADQFSIDERYGPRLGGLDAALDVGQ